MRKNYGGGGGCGKKAKPYARSKHLSERTCEYATTLLSISFYPTNNLAPKGPDQLPMVHTPRKLNPFLGHLYKRHPNIKSSSQESTDGPNTQV